jgi:papain like protease
VGNVRGTRLFEQQLKTRSGRRRLGRHVVHDPRSLRYPARERPLRSVLHRRHCPPFNQGDTNGCTGFAAAGLLMTTPLFKPSRMLTEGDALNLYARGSHLDSFRGTFPTEDPGSSGLAVMKVAKQLGYVKEYGHAFGLDQALRALVAGPVITGVNWYESFDRPRGSDATLTKSGRAAGGHEFLVVGLDTSEKMVRACNSWGTEWGDGGYFQFSFELWDELLHLHGDVTTPFVARPRRR